MNGRCMKEFVCVCGGGRERERETHNNIGETNRKTLLATQQSQIHHRNQTGFTGSVLSANDLGSVYL